VKEITVRIHNLLAYITSDSEALQMIQNQLSATIFRYERRGRVLQKVREYVPIYEEVNTHTICIGIPGLRKLKDTMELLRSTHEITVNHDDSAYKVKKLVVPKLPYTLRDYQLEAFNALIGGGTGIVQLPTGSGKTEVILAVAKALHDSDPNCVTIVIEPTKVGEETILKRSSSYSIEAVPFRNIKLYSKNTVLIPTTPKVMLNKIEKALSYLEGKSVVVISDECHHTSSVTWNSLIRLLNPVRCYGFSATPTTESMEHSSYRSMSYGDAALDSISGPLVYVNWFKNESISKHLNHPILIDYNIWGDSLDSSYSGNDWTILKELLYSDERLEELAKVVDLFNSQNLTTVVFMHEMLPARSLMSMLADDKSMCWFGSGSCFFKGGSHVVKSLKDVSTLIESGKIRNIIATTHLDEAVDVPEIDVAILQEWKLPRKSVQRAGRVLRRSSTGNSFIVNVWHSNPILAYHAKVRRNALCEEYGDSYVTCRTYNELVEVVGSKFAPISN
jgi:superfamily II DNA or RNA helicase